MNKNSLKKKSDAVNRFAEYNVFGTLSGNYNILDYFLF